MRAAAAGLALALAVVGMGSAWAHEVLHQIERGRAIAVKVFFADGEPIMYGDYAVFSPADGKVPYQKGRTDRAGYLAFVPDVSGPWHVKVAGANGHGLEIDVPVSAADNPVDPMNDRGGGRLASWAFALRPALGAVLIVGLFAVVIVLYRRKGVRR